MSQDDFYIGYLDKAPKNSMRRVRIFVILLALIMPLSAWWMVSHQRGFSTGEFEFGNLSEFEGTLIYGPVPRLQTEDKTILLIGYGKFGAESSLGINLDSDAVLYPQPVKAKLRGTLIQRDGYALLELTEGEKSLLLTAGDEVLDLPTLQANEAVELDGEIIDPKCYFGVMKPGEGKPHRSCAIRCISGGIPAVLHVRENEEDVYYIIRGENNEQVNASLLDYVGRRISVKGLAGDLNEWKLLRINPADIELLD
jgi:hypothetical protein